MPFLVQSEKNKPSQNNNNKIPNPKPNYSKIILMYLNTPSW